MIQSDDEILRADGFDEAIMGRCARTGILIYSYEKCIEVLRSSDGKNIPMLEVEAREYMEYNVIGAYMGPGTPIFLVEGSSDEIFEELDNETST